MSGDPRLLHAAREWIWRHSRQPDGDRWNDDPKRLDWAAENLLVDLAPWLVSPEPEQVTAARGCWCAHCEGVVLAHKHPNDSIARLSGRRFITCRDCGDKRCPRAAHHDRACANQPSVEAGAVSTSCQPPGMTDEGIVIPMSTLAASRHVEPPCRHCGSRVVAHFEPDSEPGQVLLTSRACSDRRCRSRASTA